MRANPTVARPDQIDFVLRAWEALLDGRTEQLRQGLPDRRRQTVVDPDAAFGAVGGYLVEGGDWLRLPVLRQRIRAWGGGYAGTEPGRGGIPAPWWTTDEAWLCTIADAMLILPEERDAAARCEPVRELFRHWAGHHRPRQRVAARPPEAIAAGRRGFLDDAGTHLPVRPAARPARAYSYSDIRPEREADFHRKLGKSLESDGVRRLRQDATGSGPAWVAARPDREVTSLLGDPRRRAHLAHALAEHHLGTPSFGARSRHAFIALLRPGGPDCPDQLATVGATLFRAWKLATYCRVAQYLDVRYPGWRDPQRWNVLVPLGDGGRLDGVSAEPMPGPSPDETPRLLDRLPVPALWVALWDRWVEPVDCSHSNLAVIATRGAAWRGLLQEDKGSAGTRNKFAAFVELAAADIRPPLEITPVLPVGRWTAAQQLFLHAVSVILDYAEAAGGLDEPFAATRRPEPWQPPRRRPAPPSTGAGPDDRASARDELRRADAKRLDELEVRLSYQDAYVKLHHRPEKGAARHFNDADELHEWALALRRHTDTNDRLRLTRGLVTSLAWRVRDPDLDDAAVADIMNSVQMLSVDVMNTAPQETERLFWPVIEHLPTGRGGPFVANVLRSIAIQHSKAHRYLDAQIWVQWASNWLEVRERGHRWRTNDLEAIQLHEASQQIALQSAGLHLRILEWLLSHPKYADLGPREHPRALERLLSIATHALRHAGDAYTELELIQRNFDLPPNKIKERAATQAWVTNTRCMFMRALLLRAMLHFVEADSEYLHPGARREAESQAAQLRDYVPVLYAETTIANLPANFVNELTRIALHYAFLTGQRFLTPMRQDGLPRHLARPVPGSAHDGSPGRLDVVGASQHLIDQGHNAGILASITYPMVKNVLQKRGFPGEVREGAWGRREVPPSYREWLRDRDFAVRLRRQFAPAEFLRTTRLLVPQPTISVPY